MKSLYVSPVLALCSSPVYAYSAGVIFSLELEFCSQSASLVKFVSFTFHSEFFTFNMQDEILTVNFLVFSPLYCSSAVLISVLTVMQSIIVLS